MSDLRNKCSDEELMEELKDLGTFYWLRPEDEEKDYRFALNLFPMHIEYNGYNDYTLNDDGSILAGTPPVTLDINVLDDKRFDFEVGLCSQVLAVSELGELQKLLSIMYGSPFSIKMERIKVGWVRYEITIPMLKCYSVYDLEKNIETLRHVIVQILNTVKLQGNYEDCKGVERN